MRFYYYILLIADGLKGFFYLSVGINEVRIDLSDGLNAPSTVWRLDKSPERAQKRSPPGELPRYDLPRKL